MALSCASFSQTSVGGSGICASHNVKQIDDKKMKVTLKNSCGEKVIVQYCYYQSGHLLMNAISATGGKTKSTTIYPDQGTTVKTNQGFSYKEADCR